MKKIIALLLALLMLATITACNSSSPGGSPSASPSATTETLKLGVISALTGWFAPIDKGNIDPLMAYVELINERGGWDIGGKKYLIEIVLSDVQSDPNLARTAAMDLIDKGIDIVLQTTDLFARGILDVWEEYEVMHVTQFHNSITFLGPDYPHGYLSNGGARANYKAALTALRQEFPDAKTLLYCEIANGSNEDNFEKMIKPAAAELGFTVIPEPVIYDPAATEFSAVALSVYRANADAYIGATTPTNQGAIIRELRALGCDTIVVTANPQSLVTMANIAGPEAAYNMLSLAVVPGSDGLTQVYNDIHAKYREMQGEEVASLMDPLSPNTLYVLLQMMSIAGTTEKKAVMEAWLAQETIDTLNGRAPICGSEALGSPRLVATPQGISIRNSKGELEFKGFVDCYVR